MYGESGIEIHEIEDVYRTLFVSVFFDNLEDYRNFEFNLFFDIQMTLENKYVLNVYNMHTVNRENQIILLKTYHSLVDAIAMLETLIADPRYVIRVTYEERINKRGQIELEELTWGDTYKLDKSEVAKLRTFRNRLLELASYS